jgi:hypothetical protein
MAEDKIIVLRCACGKHYRFRNPRGGTRATCAVCGSLLEVTEADLLTAFAPDGSIHLQEEVVEAKEALPIDGDDLTMAGKGARPGLTEGVAYSHEEALLAEALGGRRLPTADNPAAAPGRPAPAAPGLRRRFLYDLLASFWFAGNKRNAANIGLTALAQAILITPLAGTGPFLFAIQLLLTVIVTFYALQFLWFVLCVTAAGEDEVPWFESGWSLWSDMAKPALWLIIIALLCTVPAGLVRAYLPAVPWKPAAIWTVLAIGWFFWPVAVMSVALGNSILFVRPDWLLRCVWGIGPVYLIAWLLVMATLASWGIFLLVVPTFPGLPCVVRLIVQVAFVGVNLYFGYVTFRMLGLLFRHFRARFPWKY